MEQPNMSYIDKLSGGDESFKTMFLDIIKKESPMEKLVYCNNIREGNFSDAAENVHKLKHKISILGLEKSYTLAADYENNLKENKVIGRESFESVLQIIEVFLKQI